MAKRNGGGRYAVTGPGLEGVSYADFGPALSRATTAALGAWDTEDTTFYVRDLDGTVLGFSEYFKDTRMVVTTSRVPDDARQQAAR